MSRVAVLLLRLTSCNWAVAESEGWASKGSWPQAKECKFRRQPIQADQAARRPSCRQSVEMVKSLEAVMGWHHSPKSLLITVEV